MTLICRGCGEEFGPYLQTVSAHKYFEEDKPWFCELRCIPAFLDTLEG